MGKNPQSIADCWLMNCDIFSSNDALQDHQSHILKHIYNFDIYLQNHTKRSWRLCSRYIWEKNSSYRLIEYHFEALSCQCGTFDVLDGANCFTQLPPLCISDGCLVPFFETHYSFSILPQVQLCSDQDDWYIRTVMFYLGVPLK